MKGLYHKYNVTHSDGSPVDGECFVLKFSDPAARRALLAYAIAVQDNNPQLSADIALMVRNHNQNHELPTPAIKYCWSEDGEAYNGEHASVELAIQEAQAQCDFDPLTEVWVGQVVPGRDLIKPVHIGDYLDEHICEMLCEETGDAAENFSLTREQQETLGQIVIDWVDLHGGFNCYGVQKIRYYLAPFGPDNEGNEVVS